MNNRLLLIAFLLIGVINAFCQEFKPTYQSNQNLDFTRFLSGVKNAYLGMDERDVRFIKDNPTSPKAQAYLGVLDYLFEIGFIDTKWGSYTTEPQNLESLCDLVKVSALWGYNNNTFTNLTLTFVSCNNDIFKFDSETNISINGYTNIRTAFYNKCLKMYGYKKNSDIYQRLKLPSELSGWTEQKLKDYFKSNGADAFEGI